jgi:tRNA(His) 5'-end guanylyltransferase
METDSLGDRMKAYEQAEAGRMFMPMLPVCVRVDGKAFHSWTRNLDRPYDKRLSDCMIETTEYLVDKTNARIGYTQSDEISLVLYSPDCDTVILRREDTQANVRVGQHGHGKIQPVGARSISVLLRPRTGVV